MGEEFLHFIWKFQLIDVENLYCTTGERVRVLNPGSHNTHAGPDFFNAKVEIGDEVWAGNVEIHWRSSEWHKHGHQVDRAYDNVVLHLVVENDSSISISRTTGSVIKCALLRYDSSLEDRYRQMLDSSDWVACAGEVNSLDPFFTKQLLGRMLVEKLGVKVEHIAKELALRVRGWEEVFYIFIFKSFGFSINALPFELLAKSLPYAVLLKHRGNRVQMEALLFGQAGFLEGDSEDGYHQSLIKEYRYLKTKFKLSPLDRSLWKFLRTRPQNFPTIRIAQLAALFDSHVNLFSKVLEVPNARAFGLLFSEPQVSDYWTNHYRFGGEEHSVKVHLGSTSINLLAINLWVPFIFAYGHLNDQYELKEQALDLLDTLQPDRNAIIEGWSRLSMPTSSAYYTQALLHLKQHYCDTKRCLSCSIGKKVVEGIK